MMKIQGRKRFQKEFPKAAEELKKMGIERFLVNTEFNLAIHGAEATRDCCLHSLSVLEAHMGEMGWLGLSSLSGIHWPLSLRQGARRGRGRFSLSLGTVTVASQRSLWGPQLDNRGQTTANAGPTKSLPTLEH